MRLPSHLILAWLASALALSVVFVAWMFITIKLEGSPPPLKGYFRVGLLAFGAGLAIQLLYGGLIYFALSRFGLFHWWAVVLAYLVPVVLFSWRASDTTQDILGTIPWLAFAVVVALVSWFFASGRWLRGGVI